MNDTCMSQLKMNEKYVQKMPYYLLEHSKILAMTIFEIFYLHVHVQLIHVQLKFDDFYVITCTFIEDFSLE